jgi:hypothetical protein
LLEFSEVEKLLQTYTLEEILEINEITEEEVLYFLLKMKFLKVPNPEPIDIFHD